MRNVPEQTHEVLKVRAAAAGQSLSEYLLAQLNTLTATPSIEELTTRINSREPVELESSVSEIIREERDRAC
ncbi:FitA-like ribbon-helix-helix domain-containing protein [Arthrobacter castelli]|uniref:FitA-like ribbon-helix-helix domain-containing protein n=1 Tax=Arthrobacter castelli TaxID=271431 RepID=UPI0003FA8605|nr:hypothetical protein [Arthrobacter castelli]